MKVEAGICIHLSYKVKMLWVGLSALVFLVHGIIFLSVGFFFKRRVLAIDTKKKVIIWMSYISVALGLIALCAEAYLSPNNFVKIVLNDPCPTLDGWRKAVLLKVKEKNAMLMATAFRLLSFEVSCVLVLLQILDKLNHNLPVGWASWASVLSSYLMLGGTSVELYYVGACGLSLKTIVHSVLSVLSTFSSMLSIHLQLVSADRIQEIQRRNMRQKDCKISRLLAQIKRLDSQIKRLCTDIRGLQTRQRVKDDEIRDLKADVTRKETTIQTLIREKSEASQKYTTCKNQRDAMIRELKADMTRKETTIQTLNREKSEASQKYTTCNDQKNQLDAKIRELEADVTRKETKIQTLIREKSEALQKYTRCNDQKNQRDGKVLRMATEQPKAAAEDVEILDLLFEDDDKFEEFEIDLETDSKEEGKEVTQEWEDDWNDDDDDFSLQLRREVESNNNDKK